MEFSSSSVMAYILYKAKKAGHSLSKTQAQKLLYCCYGIVLAAFDERLTDEHPKAWPGGPLFPRALSDINGRRLTTGMAEFPRALSDIDGRRLTTGMAERFIDSCPADWLKLMDKTLDRFWGYSATALETWSQRKGTPWDKADPLASLDDREIQKYFRQFVPIIQGAAT